MIVAIDWDNTYTRNAVLWNRFIELCHAMNIVVIVATGRPNRASHRIEPPFDIPVIYCDGDFKRKCCEKAGYMVNIWIDDIPEMIGHARILSFDEDPVVQIPLSELNELKLIANEHRKNTKTNAT